MIWQLFCPQGKLLVLWTICIMPQCSQLVKRLGKRRGLINSKREINSTRTLELGVKSQKQWRHLVRVSLTKLLTIRNRIRSTRIRWTLCKMRLWTITRVWLSSITIRARIEWANSTAPQWGLKEIMKLLIFIISAQPILYYSRCKVRNLIKLTS